MTTSSISNTPSTSTSSTPYGGTRVIHDQEDGDPEIEIYPKDHALAEQPPADYAMHRKLAAMAARENRAEQEETRQELPFHLVIKNGTEQELQAMIAERSNIIEDFNDRGLAALHIAAIYRPEFLSVLITAGADVNKGTGQTGVTPLQLLLVYNPDHLPAFCASAGSQLQINQQSRKGYTALHSAIFWCPTKVKELLAMGADPMIKNADGHTPIALAQNLMHSDKDKIEHQETVLCLLEAQGFSRIQSLLFFTALPIFTASAMVQSIALSVVDVAKILQEAALKIYHNTGLISALGSIVIGIPKAIASRITQSVLMPLIGIRTMACVLYAQYDRPKGSGLIGLSWGLDSRLFKLVYSR